MDIVLEKRDFKVHTRVDRLGIFASIFCAIHCALTPVLLIMLPAFGKAWSHPSTHWGMAIMVIPIAVFMMVKGYKRHGRKWVILAGVFGVLCIIVGAILPYLESAEPVVPAEVAAGCASGGGCVDQCCPSIVTNESGEKSLYIPPASVVTTVGGLFLIAVHLGNLCGCRSCAVMGDNLERE